MVCEHDFERPDVRNPRYSDMWWDFGPLTLVYHIEAEEYMVRDIQHGNLVYATPNIADVETFIEKKSGYPAHFLCDYSCPAKGNLAPRGSEKTVHGLWDHHLVKIDGRRLVLKYALRENGFADFSWGYHGTGPQKLATALAFRYTQDREVADILAPYLKEEIVARLPKTDFQLPVDTILEWLRTHTSDSVKDRAQELKDDRESRRRDIEAVDEELRQALGMDLDEYEEYTARFTSREE